MKTVLIVYQSRTGGTRQMAEAAAAGAATEPGAAVVLREASTAGPADVLAADGFVFATPEYLAAVGGAMKDFFDRSYYAVLDRITGRPWAALVCAGSDGQNAARQLVRIATGWRLAAIAPPLVVCTRAQTPEAILAPKVLTPADVAACTDLGAALAAGLVLGIF